MHLNPLEDHTAHCPWCGAPIGIRIDVGACPQTYIEDCEVCCAPMVVHATLDPDREDGLVIRLERDGD